MNPQMMKKYPMTKVTGKKCFWIYSGSVNMGSREPIKFEKRVLNTIDILRKKNQKTSYFLEISTPFVVLFTLYTDKDKVFEPINWNS